MHGQCALDEPRYWQHAGTFTKTLDINLFDRNTKLSISLADAQNRNFETGTKHLKMAFELEPVSKSGWNVVLIMMNIGKAHLDNALSPANNSRANQARETPN